MPENLKDIQITPTNIHKKNKNLNKKIFYLYI